MGVRLFSEPFDPWSVVRERERALPMEKLGAASVFVGRMRDFNDAQDIRGMFLEHYPGMTERELERIVAEAEARWPSITCEVAHRTGSIDPADTLVLVAVWSAHRVAARDACAQILERLKHEAPFWKRERLADGSERWVERNTPGS